MNRRQNFSFAVISLLIIAPMSFADGFRIAAASSLQFALRDVVDAYEEHTQLAAPKVVYGSSGNLFRQIQQGAPFELFFSARSDLVSALNEKGFAKDQGDRFGLGRLVLLRADKLLKPQSLVETINSDVIPDNRKLAIANPVHAPYGRAAKQVLESLDLWNSSEPHLVYGEQVSQATQFVVSGAAPYGLVSLSLALSDRVASKTDYLLLEAALHEPIELQMVQLSASGDSAKDFYQFVLSSETVNDIFKQYGLR